MLSSVQIRHMEAYWFKKNKAEYNRNVGNVSHVFNVMTKTVQFLLENISINIIYVSELIPLIKLQIDKYGIMDMYLQQY